jgi:hypothetical protein
MIPGTAGRARSLSGPMRILTIAVLLGACGDDGNHADAAHNNGDGLCGADDYYTGEIIDWDTPSCGVNIARLTVHTDTARTDVTSPNGRWELCIKPAPMTLIDVAPPAGASQCASHGLYQLAGTAVAYEQIISAGTTQSYRMIGMDQVASQFPTFDGGLALVFVHVEGTQHAVTVSGTHDNPIAWNGTAWAPGDTGVNVVFPNVSGTSTMVGVASGSAIGTGAIPLTAGQFTYVTIAGN